jgi:transcriptional regulator with XRE-family HTH domain
MVDSVDAEVGRRLRLRRKQLGLSQSQLANRLKIAQTQLVKYESGANRLSVGRLMDCAKALDVPVTYFTDPHVGETVGVDADHLSASEQRLLCHFRVLSDTSAQHILDLVKRFSELEK